jgi:hypothetical protein
MRRPERKGDQGRDYATLLGMGWTPDTVGEAVQIAADLLREGDSGGALAAVEAARAIQTPGEPSEADRAALEAVAFEVALQRGDAPRAIGAANALRQLPSGLPPAELARLRSALDSSTAFRAELREALAGVLDSVVAGGPAPSPFPRSEANGELFLEEDELPYLAAEPGLLERLGTHERSEAAPLADPAVPEWLDPGESSQSGSWTPGAFAVAEGDSLADIRSRFLEAAGSSGTEHAQDACETAWSFFLMEDFEAAAVLFDQSLGDPRVRVSAAEGLVRCKLNLSQAGEAVVLLERLRDLCFAGSLPDALRYWYGRAAEASGDTRKARAAYRSLPAGAFPDVQARLGALP